MISRPVASGGHIYPMSSIRKSRRVEGGTERRPEILFDTKIVISFRVLLDWICEPLRRFEALPRWMWEYLPPENYIWGQVVCWSCSVGN